MCSNLGLTPIHSEKATLREDMMQLHKLSITEDGVDRLMGSDRLEAMIDSTGEMAGFGWGTNSGHYEEFQYLNAATCPDCGGAMIRMGNCFSCATCGFGSCSG